MLFFVAGRLASISGRAFVRGCGKLNDYLYVISNDYRNVIVSSIKDSRHYPLKTALYSSSCASLFYLYRTNPSYSCFVRQLTVAANDLAAVGEPIRSVKSVKHIDKLSLNHRLHKLRHISFFFCSVLWLDNFPKSLKTYESNCKFLKVGWVDMLRENRVIDFGIAGRWLVLRHNMKDYDINEDEWPQEQNWSYLKFWIV